MFSKVDELRQLVPTAEVPGLNFTLMPLLFKPIALDPIFFPNGRSANLFRGALGKAFHAISPDAYNRYFEPVATAAGPSGFANPPRPFVLRPGHLEGCQIPEGESFSFQLNLFDARPEAAECFRRAVELMFLRGLGAGRGRARLDSVVAAEPLCLSLAPGNSVTRTIRVRFLTPTVLDSLEFAVLFARLRDRIGNLRRFYGDGPLPLDFRAIGERAATVKLISSDVQPVRAQRTSQATGQTHPLGGFVGTAVYEGDLAEFLPFLEAGYWTGVGSRTVWGNGLIATEVISPANLPPASDA